MDNQPYQPQYQQNNNSTIIIGSQKSAGTAVLLAFLFGPLGLFYASTTGGLVMLFGGGIFIVFTLGLGALITWPICMIWAYIAVDNENQAMLNSVNAMNNRNNPPPQVQSPTLQQIPAPPVPLQLEVPKPHIIREAPVEYNMPIGNVSKNEVYADIEQLSKLKEMDILTQEEFEAQKTILLNKLLNL